MCCLWCDEAIIPEINWSNIILLPKPKTLCDDCKSKLKILHGNRCKKCSRSSEEVICKDCSRWEGQTAQTDPLQFNYSIFSYNQQMQDIITKWKYRGDYCLGNIFKDKFVQGFKDTFSFLSKDIRIVPIPLSTERLKERGFNQAQMLAGFLPYKQKDVLKRIHGEKQSKKTRQERLITSNPFIITERLNKPVVLVDDIYTTGTTIRHAAVLLKEQGCTEVYAYTLIRG
ncbi:ComF family protein [Virgibacillus byunsanensis]|uniref:ComF family protein n=1 Tax=Virgibacillus byunsanensis TaxID=570945 RepID=A0ABW3LKG8_9BACI